MSMNWRMPASPARYRTARRMKARFSTANVRASGMAAMISSAASLSAG